MNFRVKLLFNPSEILPTLEPIMETQVHNDTDASVVSHEIKVVCIRSRKDEMTVILDSMPYRIDYDKEFKTFYILDKAEVRFIPDGYPSLFGRESIAIWQAPSEIGVK